MTTERSALPKSKRTPSALGCRLAGNDQCVDSARVGLLHPRGAGSAPRSSQSYANALSRVPRGRGILGHRRSRAACARIAPPVTTHRRSARTPYPSARVDSPTLLQFVFLSMLLHLLFVVLFGTTTSGGARRGDGEPGSLDVTLRYMSPERGSGFTLAPGADTDLPGTAMLRRKDGSPPTPAVRPQGEAATVVLPQEATSPPLAAPVPAAPETSASLPEISLPARTPPAESLPRLDRNAPVEVDKPLMAPAVSPPKVAPPAPEPEAPPRVTMPPLTPLPSLEPIAPPTFERQVAPVELRQREVPIAPRPAPAEPKPREEPVRMPAPVEPIAPAKVERDPSPAVEVKPRDAPIPPIAPVERIAPPVFERGVTPATEPPVPRKAPVETTAPARVAPTPERAAPASAREPAPATQPAPRSLPADAAPAKERAAPAGGELPRLRLGAPTVDEEVFGSRRDVATPAAEPGAAPAITAESLRKRAGEIAREGSGSSGVLNLVPPPPLADRKDKLAEDIAKAAKPDCRTAYAGMGLLAVVPLVASTVGNGGCRW
jgi:hypothetical protein